jgi:tartronate-semialdehyde synthase
VGTHTEGRTFVHVDIQPTQIGRVFAPDYSIVSDARAALEVFVEVAGEWAADGWLADRSAWAQECCGRKQTLQRKTEFDQRQARAPARLCPRLAAT